MLVDALTPDRHFAIVIGIDRYPALSDLRGACNDAIAFHDWLTDEGGGGVPAANVRLHLGREAVDARSATPKKWEIDADLDELIDEVRAVSDRSGPRTRLYLYFAGHGLAAGTGTGAWLMADAKHNLFNNLALSPYREWLDRCRDFDEVVMLSDCCRSLMADVPETPQPHTCHAPQQREQRVFAAHGADIGERAFETQVDGDEIVRGHFTRALLEGLRGSAADAIGEVRAGPLAEHLRTRVHELSAGVQRAQVLQDDRIVLAVQALALSAVRIQLVASGRRSVRVLGASGVVAADVRGDGTWELRLVDGDYQFLDANRDDVVRFSVAGADLKIDG